MSRLYRCYACMHYFAKEVNNPTPTPTKCPTCKKKKIISPSTDRYSAYEYTPSTIYYTPSTTNYTSNYSVSSISSSSSDYSSGGDGDFGNSCSSGD